MAIDLRKNKDSLYKAYEKVVDDKDKTDWALFGYEGQTPVLKVVQTGDGGFEELVDELSSGKMLYAYCRVTDPNSGLFKFVLIHWTGESVPENLKLKYTSHLKDVQGFLKSIHITIPARSEVDIDADDILKKVAKSSGANYGFHKETAKPVEPSGPVGTDYHRVIPTKEINISARDQFWAKAEKDELARQNAEKIRLEEERKQAEADRKDREMRETKEREKKISEHSKEVTKLRQAEKKAEDDHRTTEKQRWEQIQKESSIDEEERGHRSDQMRRDRQVEAAHLVTASKTSSARDFFKQKSVERPDVDARRAPPPPRKIRHGFGDQQNNAEEAPPVRKEPPPVRKEPTKLPSRNEPEPPSKPVRKPEPEPEIVAEPEYEPEPEQPQRFEPVSEPEPAPGVTSSAPKTRDLLRDGLPPRHDSDAEDEDQDWDAPPAEDFEFREKRVPSYHEDYAAEQQHAETQSHRVSGAQHFEEPEEEEQEPEEEQQEPEEEQQPAVPASSLTADQGQCARALYDYQAADDTEISFDPDDIITNIEQIDDGWWQGFAPNGSYGMFPSNYVELIE